MENVEIKENKTEIPAEKKASKKKSKKKVEKKEAKPTGALGWMLGRNEARKKAGLPPAYSDDQIAKERMKS